MKLLDSNIIIYSSKAGFEYLKPLVFDRRNAVSVITEIEVLGYHKLTESEKVYFDAVFQTLQVLRLIDPIVNMAIEIKQSDNIESADAIIAATAWLYRVELITRNTEDYKNIKDIVVVNPIL